MRKFWTLLLVIGGFAIQAISYFSLAAPLGLPTGPEFSDPRVPFAAAIFVAGVMMVFIAALVYELMPGEE
ncbi:MAG: hypothetical protein V3V62_09665 [bacterium]